MADQYHSALTGANVHPCKGDSRVGDYTLADDVAPAYAIKDSTGATMFALSTSNTQQSVQVYSGISPLAVIAGTAGQAAPTAIATTFLLYTERTVLDTYSLKTKAPDGTVYTLAPPASLSGTDSLTWTVNQDGTSASDEDPELILMGGDGVAPTSNDLVRTRLYQDSSAETVQLFTQRNRNSGGYANIATAFHIGQSGSILGINPSLVMNSGTGAAARTWTATFSGSTGDLTWTATTGDFVISRPASVNGSLSIINTGTPLLFGQSALSIGSTSVPVTSWSYIASIQAATIALPVTLMQLLTGLSGATVDTTTASFPANSVALGVSIRITSTVTGATSFDVGTAANPTLFGSQTNMSSGQTNIFVPTAWSPFTSSTAIRLTAQGGSFSGGNVRVTIHYYTLTAPTS